MRWNQFITHNGLFTSEHREYRRVSLINSLLLFMVVLSFLALLNGLISGLYAVAVIDIVGAVFSILLLWYFHKTNQVQKVSVLLVLMIALLLLFFIHVMGHQNYALYWITVVPPISYFLLGLKYGNIATGAFFCVVLAAILLQYENWVGFERGAVTNIVFASASLIAMVRYYKRSIEEAGAALEQKNAALDHLAKTDNLTGLSNRMELDRVLKQEVLRSERSGHALSIMMADLDRFKRINDQFGHMLGDEIIVDTARLLVQSCRQTDILGRWGGEEFLIICPDTDRENAVHLAERIRKNIEKHVFTQGLRICVSIGIAEYQNGDTPMTLVKRADDAMYEAKTNGRNQVVVSEVLRVHGLNE